MKLKDYINETNNYMNDFEDLLNKPNGDNDTYKFCDMFDIIENRLALIEMYKANGLKDDDELPGPIKRLIFPKFC